MITREQTDAKIVEIKAKSMTDDLKQQMIDEALTVEANQLEHGNNVAVAQSVVFGLILLWIILVI